MDDYYDENVNNGLVDSSSYILCGNNAGERESDQLSSHPLGRKIQAKKVEEMSVQVSCPTSVLIKNSDIQKKRATDAKTTTPLRNYPELYCHVRLDSINKLKDSTRKLLCLLEEIQSKTFSKDFPPQESNEFPLSSDSIHSISDVVAAPALQQLEAQTKTLNTIYIEDEDDDCSIFKRLTRKCHCLNQQQYNDFVIHFNEDTKYFTNTIGEVIKNMRIVKQFLYMGGAYTKNALTFLNEGLADSTYTEKVEITLGCSHADVCNVFEDNSIVVMCISWPSKMENYGDSMTQNLAASFLYKLAELEEGRRYLKYTSRITNDIKKILRKKGSKLDMDTTESLNAALNLMHPPLKLPPPVSYYCRPNDEDYGNQTIKALKQYRQYMTLDEVFTHLDLLHNLSNEDKGKTDLTPFLPGLLILFKEMLKEFDNSEMNIIITNILNNIVSKNMLTPSYPVLPKTFTMADTATEPIKMKNEIIQMPPPKKKINYTKKASNKSKSNLGAAPNKSRQPSRRKVSEWEHPAFLNRSKKFHKDRRHDVIVVPIEKK